MKIVKIAGKTVFFFIMILILYSGWTIYESREYTVRNILENEKKTQYQLRLSSLTERQIQILLKVEDPNFYNHKGVDLTTPGAGITTITQSLVKNLYFKKFKPGIAKFEQTLIAYFALNPLMSKEQQLTRFVNTVYLGNNVKGFQEAAKYYFNKNFSEITEDEYLSLVAMIIAPNTFNIKKRPQLNQQRVDRIKLLISGKYKPQGLCDLYYGKIDNQYQKKLPPFSYFEFYYK